MEDSSTPRETPRPVTENSSDGSSVIVIVVPVSTAGTLLVFTTIAVLLVVIVFLICLQNVNFVGIGSTHKSSSQEKCDVVENSAYGVTVQGSAGGRLEPNYNMENNPLYEMRSLSNDTHSPKTQTTAPVVLTIDSVTV